MSLLVLWGHHVDDYQEMFNLQENELRGKILEFGCGPSAFNIELAGVAEKRVSCDPLFNLDSDTLKAKSGLIFADKCKEAQENSKKYTLHHYETLQTLIQKRAAGMRSFFEDYDLGKKQGRYVAINEIHLPFEDFSFDLALSSYYLFSQLEDQSVDFHVAILKELARVAKEVRVVPLVDNHEHLSPLLGPVLLALQQENYGTEIRSVDYPLAYPGSAMLKIWAQECKIES